MESINKIWPQWQAVEVIGKGGFGTVYKAKRESFGETSYSAIKVVSIPGNPQEIEDMSSSGLSEASIKEYYYNSVLDMVSEIKMMSKFKSASHIVSIEDYHVLEQPNTLGWTIYIRMELLTNILKHYKDQPVTVEEVVKMALHILTALEFCHERHIIHRDIKPGNIFISEFGEYKLGDFGISREAEKTNAAMSQKGTKSYMAPEIIRLDQYGKNVDLYALGLTMYELLNHGRMPFLPAYPQPFYPKDREEAVVRRINGEIVPDINGIGELNVVLKKACHPDKNQRFQNATEMKKALLEYQTNSNQQTTLFTVDEEQTVNLFNSNHAQEKTVNAFNTNNNEEKTVSVFDTNYNEEKTMSVFDEAMINEATLGVFENGPKDNFVFEDTVGVFKSFVQQQDNLTMERVEHITCEVCGKKLNLLFPNVYVCRNRGTPDYNITTKKTEYINPCMNLNVPIPLQKDPKTLEYVKLYQKMIHSKDLVERLDLVNQIYQLNPNDYHTVSVVESMYWGLSSSLDKDFYYKNSFALTYKLCDYHIKKKDFLALKAILEKIKFKHTFYKQILQNNITSDFVLRLFSQYLELYRIVEANYSDKEILDCFNRITKTEYQDKIPEKGCYVCGGNTEEIIPGIEECVVCGKIVKIKEPTKTYKEYVDLIEFQLKGNYNFEPAWSRRLYATGITRDQMIRIVKKRKFGAKSMQEFISNFAQAELKEPNLLNEAKKAYNIEEKVLCAYTTAISMFGKFEKKKYEFIMIFTELGIYFKVNQEIHTIYYFELDGYKFQNGLFGHLIIKGNQQRFELKCNLEATMFAQVMTANIKKHV